MKIRITNPCKGCPKESECHRILCGFCGGCAQDGNSGATVWIQGANDDRMPEACETFFCADCLNTLLRKIDALTTEKGWSIQEAADFCDVSERSWDFIIECIDTLDA